jgi:CheY-like chemotaxis protein
VALEHGNYNYAFISSRYAVEAISALGEKNMPLQLIIIGELGESSFYREVSNIMMPVYSINLAHILNNESEMVPSQNTKLNIHFTAPQVKTLIVDDITTNLRVAKELMTPYNMDISACLSGAEAIDLVKNNRYDLVFMDHMMPGMDGIEATAFIRNLDPNDAYYRELPIIALTANAVSGQREIFLQNGINDLLTKPINIQKLNDLLEKWIPPEKKIPYSQSWERGGAPVPEIVIAGVDTEKGLHNTGGSETAYLDILADFCRDVEAQAVKINGALETGNITLYITLVHALKGAARSIGAVEASDAAAWLEQEAEKEDRSIIRDKTADLLKCLRLLTDAIRSVLEQKNSGKEGGDVSCLHLETLKTALDEMNIEAVNRMFLEYAGLSLDKKTRDLVAELEQHILMFEYDEAIEKINFML